MLPEIKFCGLTRGEDAQLGAQLGGSYLGVIFAGGPRHQSAESAQAILGAAMKPPQRVAVVSSQSPVEVAGIVSTIRADVVQLHADPDVARVTAIRDHTSAQIWAVVRVAADELPPLFDEIAGRCDAVVLDARSPTGLGGSGIRLPWDRLARSVEQRRGNTRIVLAGGLVPESVGEAIEALEPDIVDVSSGVESAPGIKDHQRMRAFVAAVREAGARRT